MVSLVWLICHAVAELEREIVAYQATRDDTLHRRVAKVAPVAKEGEERWSHVGCSSIVGSNERGPSPSKSSSVQRRQLRANGEGDEGEDEDEEREVRRHRLSESDARDGGFDRASWNDSGGERNGTTRGRHRLQVDETAGSGGLAGGEERRGGRRG
jgi:hypothetical protein